MNVPLVIGASVALIAAIALVRRLRRTNAAGIRTSAAGRALAVGGLATRSGARKAALRLRQAVTSRERRAALETAYHIKTSAEVAQMMGQMKGVFMKLGQIASFARESLPPEARAMLEGLQNDAPPMSFELARGVIEAELGRPLAELYADFDPEPLAAASIGQVHRARLPTGEDVVVKVQYPGVDDAIRADLRFTQGLVGMVSAFFRNADAHAMVAELKARLEDELDYRVEAEHQRRFAEIWRGHPLIRVPEVFPSHSGRRVLTQGFAEGLSFKDFLEVAEPAEKRLAVLVLNDFVFDSMHLFSMFNGDPHPGNYLFAPDGGIVFLDFGCTKRFDGDFLGELRALNRAILEEDLPAFEAGLHKTGIILPGRELDMDLAWAFFGYHARPFAKDAVFAFTSDYLKEAGETMRMDNLRRFNLPPDLIFFNRITFGLNAIFGALGASENFHRLYRRYLYPSEDLPPALAAVGGVDLPERFLHARPWTGVDAVKVITGSAAA